MTPCTLASARSFKGLAAFLVTFVLTLAAMSLLATSAWADPSNNQGKGAVMQIADLEPGVRALATGTSSDNPFTTATDLAAALNAGRNDAPATGDDATGVVTVTGVCDGGEGSLPNLFIRPGSQLLEIAFDGSDASIVFDSETEATDLCLVAEEDADVPFALSGTGTIEDATAIPAIQVGNATYQGTLLIESGVTIESTAGGGGLALVNGSADLVEGATIEADGGGLGVQVGFTGDGVNPHFTGSLTVSGTISSPAGMALNVSNGQCTVKSSGRLVCNTDEYVGVEVGSHLADIGPDNEATLTLDGGTIEDLSEDSKAPVVAPMGFAKGGTATFEMLDGEVTGGGPNSAAVHVGRNVDDLNEGGVATIEGGFVGNQEVKNGGFAIYSTCDSDVTVTGGDVYGTLWVGSECTGTTAIEGGTVAGIPGVKVSSPEATVTFGSTNSAGPFVGNIEEGATSAITLAEGCTATVLSGSFAPSGEGLTVADSVTEIARLQRSGGQLIEYYGQKAVEAIHNPKGGTITVLRATEGKLSIPETAPGVKLVNDTGETGEVAVVTPYGVVTLTPGSTGVVPALPENAVTVYRLYNPYLDGAHLLTTDENEVATLKAAGWEDEGARFSGYAEPSGAMTTIYRLYNPNNCDHFFTASEDEATALEGIGWQREGVAWYAPTETTIPAYRLYNPYQTAYEGLGNHLWTTLEGERDELVDLGWLGEGTGWYALPLE